VLSDAELEAELIRMTDSYTDELFDLSDCVANTILFPVSRLVLDPERFVDDAQERMSRKGMGVVYTHTSSGCPLRRDLPVPLEDRQLLIRQYYEPHHEKLTRAVEDALACSGRCLILDCHSFPSVPLPFEFEQSPLRPDICLGTDVYHTPGWLTESAATLFSEENFRVELNKPFPGALVPMDYYRKVPNVWSLMIEVNRGWYMDEATGTRSGQFDSFRTVLQSVLRRLLRQASIVK